MNELQLTLEQEYKLSCAKDFVQRTHEDLKSVTKSFFSIGFRLNEANEMKYFENLGYPNIESLAEEEFGFKRSTTYGLIKVFRRFCVKRDSGYFGVVCTNTIQEEFKDYSYSQLLEISKCNYLPVPIRECIPVSSSVRDIAAYVSEYNNPKINIRGTLPEWKARKAEEQTLPVKSSAPTNQSPGQLSIKDTLSDEQDFDTWLENQPEGTFVQGGGLDNEQTSAPTAPVQTSGLQPCADPVQKQKPQYNFQTRDGVRAFLEDYENWTRWCAHCDKFHDDECRVYQINRHTRIFAVRWNMCSEVAGEIAHSVQVHYFIELDKTDYVLGKNETLIELSKRQLEKFFTLYKDEL